MKEESDDRVLISQAISTTFVIDWDLNDCCDLFSVIFLGNIFNKIDDTIWITVFIIVPGRKEKEDSDWFKRTMIEDERTMKQV